MKTTGIKVKAVSIEDMLNDSDNASYNPSTWKESVMRFAKYPKCQFYIAPKDEHHSYDRFYVSYIADNLFFLNRFSAFSSSLSGNGFTRALILDGEIYSNPFGQNKDELVINNKEGRKWLSENICSNGVMVSNCI